MMTRYDPFREALSLRRAMDQLFEQSFVNPSMMPGSQTMLAPMDVCETDNGYEVDVALPGVRPEDIELTVDQNTLTIRGRFSHQNDHQNQPEGQTQGQQQTQPAQAQGQPSQQQSQPQSQQAGKQDGGQQSQQGKTERHRQGHNWLSREIVAGAFERSITFPRPIDTNNIQTKFENGILTIRLPISEASRPKRISLKGDTVAQSSQSSQSSQQQQVPVGAGQKQGS